MLKLQWLNCLWLLAPILAWNAAFSSKLAHPAFEFDEAEGAVESGLSLDVDDYDPAFAAEESGTEVEREESADPGAILEEAEDPGLGLTLPVLDEPGEPQLESETGPGSELPEPGWDSGGGEEDSSLPPVDDVDLGSFVTEVESADVAAQVDDEVDLDSIEPGWDEAEPEPDVPLDDEPPSEPSRATGEEVEPPPEPSGEDREPGPDEELQPASITEPAAEARGSVSRFRRPLFVAGAFVALAIVLSLVMFVLPTDVATDGEVTPAPGAESSGAQGDAGPDDAGVQPDGSVSEGLGESAGIADSTAASASAADLSRLGDDLLESVSRYYGRAVAEDAGQATCAELQAAYVEVEDLWIAYNVEGKARFRGRLPDELATRDERLYAGVQDVEREFTRSGCERP